MHVYPNVLVANTRRMKKQMIDMGIDRDVAIKISESYRGKFVVVQASEAGYVVIQHNPSDDVNHGRMRNLPHPFTKRIKNNMEFAECNIVK